MLSALISNAEFSTLAKHDWVDSGSLELVIDMHNRSDRQISDIEAIYIYTTKSWKFSQSGEECPHNDQESETLLRRHFLKVPVSRLSPGAWAQLRITGKRSLWSKFRGDERKVSYHVAGVIRLEILTSEGTFRERFQHRRRV